jgi:hypothetical protein
VVKMTGTMLLDHDKFRDTYSLHIDGCMLDRVMESMRIGASALKREEDELTIDFAVMVEGEKGCEFVPIDKYRGQ